MVSSRYSTCIVHGSTILNIGVYLGLDGGTTFMIKLNYDDDDSSDIFDLDMDAYFPSWRDRLSHIVSKIRCFPHRRAEIRKWEETMYYHFDSLIRRLQQLSPYGYNFGATFDVEFIQTSKEALEKLDMTSFAIDPDNNLLERVKYHDGNEGCSGRKDVECAICFEDFKESDDHLTRMPCSHTFHYSCLSMWLPKHESCPMCRFKLNWNTMDDLPL